MKTLKELCERSHVRIAFMRDPHVMDDDGYRVHLARRPNHGCGPLWVSCDKVSNDPEPSHILQALLDQARFGELSFVDYCIDLDLSDDSIKAQNAWSYCLHVYRNLRAFFGEKLYREFSDAVPTKATEKVVGLKYYMIDETQLRWLESVRKRLHTEDRMNGDEMRDHGHTLDGVIKTCRELEIPANCELKEKT